MHTECPHCHTIFRLTDHDLQQADGQVRCGHCLAVFEAEPQEHEPLDLAQEKSETEGSVVADVIPPELRAETQRGHSSAWRFTGTLLLSLAILLSILAGVMQYAYYNRAQLVKIPELRPWLEQACQQLNCTLPPPRDTRQIVLTSKNIFSHPNTADALMISATIVNQADFVQDYPVIELRFENVRGQTIAARRFQPEEYLGVPTQQLSKMQPDTPVNFKLEIRDPGSDMVSYEFAFL